MGLHQHLLGDRVTLVATGQICLIARKGLPFAPRRPQCKSSVIPPLRPHCKGEGRSILEPWRWGLPYALKRCLPCAIDTRLTTHPLCSGMLSTCLLVCLAICVFCLPLKGLFNDASVYVRSSVCVFCCLLPNVSLLKCIARLIQIISDMM